MGSPDLDFIDYFFQKEGDTFISLLTKTKQDYEESCDKVLATSSGEIHENYRALKSQVLDIRKIAPILNSIPDNFNFIESVMSVFENLDVDVQSNLDMIRKYNEFMNNSAVHWKGLDINPKSVVELGVQMMATLESMVYPIFMKMTEYIGALANNTQESTKFNSPTAIMQRLHKLVEALTQQLIKIGTSSVNTLGRLPTITEDRLYADSARLGAQGRYAKNCIAWAMKAVSPVLLFYFLQRRSNPRKSTVSMQGMSSELGKPEGSTKQSDLPYERPQTTEKGQQTDEPIQFEQAPVEDTNDRPQTEEKGHQAGAPKPTQSQKSARKIEPEELEEDEYDEPSQTKEKGHQTNMPRSKPKSQRCDDEAYESDYERRKPRGVSRRPNSRIERYDDDASESDYERPKPKGRSRKMNPRCDDEASESDYGRPNPKGRSRKMNPRYDVEASESDFERPRPKGRSRKAEPRRCDDEPYDSEYDLPRREKKNRPNASKSKGSAGRKPKNCDDYQDQKLPRSESTVDQRPSKTGDRKPEPQDKQMKDGDKAEKPLQNCEPLESNVQPPPKPADETQTEQKSTKDTGTAAEEAIERPKTDNKGHQTDVPPPPTIPEPEVKEQAKEQEQKQPEEPKEKESVEEDETQRQTEPEESAKDRSKKRRKSRKKKDAKPPEDEPAPEQQPPPQPQPDPVQETKGEEEDKENAKNADAQNEGSRSKDRKKKRKEKVEKEPKAQENDQPPTKPESGAADEGANAEETGGGSGSDFVDYFFQKKGLTYIASLSETKRKYEDRCKESLKYSDPSAKDGAKKFMEKVHDVRKVSPVTQEVEVKDYKFSHEFAAALQDLELPVEEDIILLHKYNEFTRGMIRHWEYCLRHNKHIYAENIVDIGTQMMATTMALTYVIYIKIGEFLGRLTKKATWVKDKHPPEQLADTFHRLVEINAIQMAAIGMSCINTIAKLPDTSKESLKRHSNAIAVQAKFAKNSISWAMKAISPCFLLYYIRCHSEEFARENKPRAMSADNPHGKRRSENT